MRRSAAPSQLQNAKRLKTVEEKGGNDWSSVAAGATKIEKKIKIPVPPVASCLTCNDSFNLKPCNKENKPDSQPNFAKKLVKPSSFKTPVRSRSVNPHVNEPEKPRNENPVQYYNVMWGKMSKKKHKKWDGDGILVTKGRTAILQDMDGKEIGKGRGFKEGELATFTEGQTLYVGGKQVEIISEISKDVYLSGRCFQQTSDDQPSSQEVKMSVFVKPFSNPQKSLTDKSSEKSCVTVGSRVVVPRHDPSILGALVMPRPSALHQWERNKKQAAVVDVVVDPYIANVLRPHQREGVTFLYECVMGLRSFAGNGAILADDMGLGKTLQCIALVWTLFKQGMYGGQPTIKRILIITPGSLVKNWASEFRKWLGNERMPVYTVNSEKKVQEFIHSPVYPAMIISYEMFVRYVEDIKKIKFQLVICDEAHRLKNSAIKTTMHISSLKIKRKVLLTGTPIQNDLTEFFSLAEFCIPGIFGSQTSFRRVYEEPIVRGRQPSATREERELGESRAHELNRLTSQFLLRRTSDINNKYLPSKVESVVFCRASTLQLNLYHHLISSRWFRSCTSTSYAGSLHLMCIAALKKLCNHPTLLYRASKVDEDIAEALFNDEESLYDDVQMYYPADYDCNLSEHSGKLKVLENMLNNIKVRVATERVVVVSNYTQTLDVIQNLCERNNYQFLRLDGKTPTNQRQNLVERFNRKGSQDFVFLLSSKAGGVGLNLTGGSTLILFDIDWNPANDIQAMARVWRDGQRKKVKIYRLLTTGTIEEKIYQRQITKQGLNGTVAGNAISSKVEFSREDLKDLFTLHTKTTCLTHDLLNCPCEEERESHFRISSAVLADEYIGRRNITLTALFCKIFTSSIKEDRNVVGSVMMASSHSNNMMRACQLGLGSRGQESKEKNLSMAELMQWKHFSRPIAETNLSDEILRSSADDIDFVFQTETNSTERTKT